MNMRCANSAPAPPPLDSNLHSLSRQLIELRIEHADLDATIDRLPRLRRKTSFCCAA